MGRGDLPSENIIPEHYRLGSTRVILSRSFCNASEIEDIEIVENLFTSGVNSIRYYENELLKKPEEFFEQNRITVMEKVAKIVERIKKSKSDKSL